ncbi:MAG: YbaK/EbsC family protein [Phyllobacteriaceae bacterium]|nr:YbaK/EbsC family protein [Phyllobacteriaceae bacterium]
MTDLPDSAARVAEAARALGLAVEVREMPASTRTAEEAATTCGCAVAQIVKSLIFRGKTSKTPWLFLVSGANRVNEKRMVEVIGEPVVRGSADDVRALTGYAIGGVPPFGHATRLATVMDEDLLGHTVVWAAAGTPHAVFATAPKALAEAVSAKIARVD